MESHVLERPDKIKIPEMILIFRFWTTPENAQKVYSFIHLTMKKCHVIHIQVAKSVFKEF